MKHRGTASHSPQPPAPCFHTPPRLFRLSAEQGLSAAQSRLGLLYAKGLGVTKDEEAAKLWWEHASKQGHHPALQYLEQGHWSSEDE